MVVSEPFVEAMKQAGLRLREYRLEPGGSVNCTIAQTTTPSSRASTRR